MAGVAIVVEAVLLILAFLLRPALIQASLAIVVLDCRSCLVAVALSLLCGCAVVAILYTPPLKQFVLALTLMWRLSLQGSLVSVCSAPC